jgi:hypothetical protein
MYVWRNIKALSQNHCCCGKAISITYFLCVHAIACVRACGCPGARACACACVLVALLIQHATRLRHVVTSFVAPLAHNIFRNYLIKGVIFGGKKVVQNVCFDFLYNLSKTFLILWRIQQDVVNVKTYSRKVSLLFLSDFNKTWIFSTDFYKQKSLNVKFHQNPSSRSRVVPWGQTDGRARRK